MANSRKPNSGCFSSIVRHLLCRNSIPTYPSTELDHAPVQKEERDKRGSHGEEVVASSSDRPGIVARLMGLETLPADFAWAPKFKKSPNSVPRSRSVNFMDYLLEIDLSHVPDPSHRRVRTSVSFRENVRQLPHCQSHDEDLLVLYLDDSENESKKEARAKSKSKSKRQESGLSNPKHMDKRRTRVGKERKVSKLGNEPKRVSKEEAQRGRRNGKQRGKLIQEKEVMAESKFTKKRREAKAAKRVTVVPIESDVISEASSPISVLDLDECVNELGTSTAQEDKDYNVNSSPKNNSSPPRMFLQPARVSDPFERRGSSAKQIYDPVSSTAYPETEYCLSVAVEVYRLTEEDIVKNSNWVNLNGKAEHFCELYEEISATIEHQVLDLVLEQLVGDLCAT
ncbi:uncharacterized protein LOC116187765 [Punica granatum]|uniref:DUF3741 domain-containing protein n=2 Tax=Punica granatum TaxID=22663 RepID=A0A218XBK9_PUNGR|nr:uncharacterized protein LOC116187765 [Punica granatum]OWM81742.1 hypothetical protein CDL15_Pgr007780 [Punica granatum]PKI43376.1 hypothetical protein CRG98_036133 [Punica granatum]